MLGTTERPEDSVGADRAVEHFAETFLGGDVEALKSLDNGLWIVDRGCSRGCNFNFCGLNNAVGIEKGSAEVDDFFAAPVHDESAGIGDVGDVDAF